MNRPQLRIQAYNKLSQSKNGNISSTVANSKVVLVDTTEYLAVKISGAGGIVELTDSDAAQKAGVQSFSKKQLATSQHMVIDAIKLDYALETATANKTVGNANYADAAPAVLKNAELTISQSSKEILRIPVSDIHNPNTTRTNDEKFRVLGHMPVLEAGQDFDIQLELPKGETMPAEDHFVRVELRGFKFKK